MLTDKQMVALSLLNTTISSANIMYMAQNVEGTKKIINDALVVADLFLETSNSELIPDDELIRQFQENNQRLQQINDALLDSQFSESTSGN
jgi:hypothetical protein